MGVGRSQNVPVAQWIEQLPSKQWVVRSSRTRDATKLTRATAYDKIAEIFPGLTGEPAVGCQRREFEVTTLSEALTAYRICAKAEGKSRRTIAWVTSSVGYFSDFLGGDLNIEMITVNDLRRFIIALQDSQKYRNHPYTKQQHNKLSPQTIETYARAIRAFFGYLCREGLIASNPVIKVKMPKVPRKVVPTLSGTDLEKLLSQPDKRTDRGFRDYTLILTFVDTSARLSEIANLKLDDVDLENGYLKVMGKGSRERYVPFGHKVAKALLKYKLKHRLEPVATDRFFLTADGRALGAERRNSW